MSDKEHTYTNGEVTIVWKPALCTHSRRCWTGLPDVFMNILTSNGLMYRYVTDWSGPETTLKRIDVKLGAPNLPGMVMTITGEVTARDDAAGTVDISVSGDNNVWGNHMAGMVRVALPKEP